MTSTPHGSPDPAAEGGEGGDQREHGFGYGHGRMPFFLKIFWIGFLAFATWYVVQFLLTSVGEELGA